MSTPRLAHRRLAILAVVASLLVALVPVQAVSANSTAQTLPYAQAWSNPALVTTNDDWSGVPGVVGYLGQDITTATGADPQTLLSDSTVANDVDVIANLVDGFIGNGGVGEFQGGLDVVGLQPNGTADAPYILVNLVTTGRTSVSVAYNLRDIDELDNAVQPVALHYRIGLSGAWTNVPSAFVADATQGGAPATLVTPVSATLPAAADNQPLVQIRIITANAAFADEWVGIDDLTVTGSVPDTAPSVSSTTPTDGAADVALGTSPSVTFSEAVDVAAGWFDITCTVSGSHAATASGGPVAFSLDPTLDFANGESCTFTIVGAKVTDQDANDPPGDMAGDHVVTFTTPSVANEVDVDGGGPYSVVEGGSVLLSAAGTDPSDGALTFAWDLDRNGTFETPGQSATFSATGLQAPQTLIIRVQATGPTGLTGQAAATVHVVWDFDWLRFRAHNHGFNHPVKAGQVLIMRFSLHGNQGLDVLARGNPTSMSYACGTTPPTGPGQPAATPGKKGLSYNARNGVYRFAWDTDKSWKRTCRMFILGLADGTTHTIAIQFK